MDMSPTHEAIVEDLADLYVIEKEVRSKPARERLGRMARRKTADTNGLRKATAAKMLGVSVNTLDKWIQRGNLAVVQDAKTGRELVDIRGFVPIFVKVRALRNAGQRDGILAAAISELEREDPEYKKSFAELYGTSLDAMAESRLKPVVVPSTFGPED
ncbi:MAG TPA: hypothetical protein VMD48_03930 [Solirubrobacteraceae bacterium]|nr:hypothetical protein [Solirubrobacteraceae bacterium]